MAVNGWIIERTVDLAHPPKTLRNEQPYEIAYTGDMANPVWTVHVLQDGQPVALGGSVKAYIRRIDGAEVISNGTISGNTVTVELGGSNFGQPGYTWGILRYTDSTTNATITLDALTMMVQADPEGTSVLDPDDMLPTLQELLAELDDMRDATAAAEAAVSFIAGEYSTIGTYSVGDYAIHEGGLYRCTTEIATAETWNDAHWTQVVFGNEVRDVKSALSEMPNIYGSDAENVDLDISDNYGNVLLRLKDGEIHTKYFHSKPTIITLKTSGGDYSTMKDALDSITDADPQTNPYEIHVYPGTYDTLEGFTDEEIRSADIGGGYTDDSMVGCKLTNGISLIGIGDRKKIILTAELSTSDYSSGIRGNISTLNLQGTCRIENLTIKAKNIRYCIHDDFGSSKHYERVVRNCVFSAYSWTLSYYPATTYGAGIASPGITALFEDCDFGFSWGYHTRASMTGDSKLVLRHCTGLTARLGDQAGDNDKAVHSFYFDGCDFAAVSITRSTATTPHIFAYGTNNLRSMLFCKAQDIPQFSSLMKTTVSALPVGTVVKVNNGGLTTTSEGITASKAESIDSAIGVIMYKDNEYDYIQRDGYIQGALLGLTSLSVGDYVTADSDMVLTATGATESNAFGVVKYTDSNDRSQIWILRR